MSKPSQLGDATLDLLADECMITILGELSRGAVRARDIESRVPGIARRTALRRLQSLAANGFASTAREPKTDRTGPDEAAPLRAPYVLTELGREWLLKVLAAAVYWEQNWCSPPPWQFGGAGLWALGLVSDRYARGIAHALADAPLRQAEVVARLPHLGRSTLLDRLKTLFECGLLVRDEHRGEVRYGLTDKVRHLAIVVVRAAQCEWQRATRQDRMLTGDLPGLLHLLAPLGHITRDAAGACRWRLDSIETDVYLTGRSGKIAALITAPGMAPGADSHASSQVWCDALLRGDPSRIATVGDEAIFNLILTGLSDALLE